MRTPPLGNPKALGEKKSQMIEDMGDRSCQGEKCLLVMSTHTGLHRNPQDDNEALMYSFWSFQPHLTTQDLGIPTSSHCAGTRLGVSVSYQPSKLPQTQLRNVIDTAVKTVILEDTKDKRNKVLGRAGGTQARIRGPSLCLRPLPRRDSTMVPGAGRGSSVAARSMTTPAGKSVHWGWGGKSKKQ